MKKTKKQKLLIAVVVAVVALVAVRVITMVRAEFLYAGTIEATKIDLPARVSSVIAAYGVEEGDKVVKGQLLVELACEDVKLAHGVAKVDFERASRLLSAGSMPRETYDHLRNKYEEVALRLGWCKIGSPVSGTVLNTYYEDAEWVNPGSRLLTVADLSEVWAIVYVPQPLLARLSLGLKVQGVLPELGGRELDGKITLIGDEAEFTPKNVQTREERTRLVYGIKVTFANPEGILKPGMPIEVRLPK